MVKRKNKIVDDLSRQVLELQSSQGKVCVKVRVFGKYRKCGRACDDREGIAIQASTDGKVHILAYNEVAELHQELGRWLDAVEKKGMVGS